MKLNFFTSFTIIVLILGSSFISPNVSAQSIDKEAEQVKSSYSSKMQKINQNLSNTKKNLDNLKEGFGEVKEQKANFEDERKSKELEISQNNQVLTEYKIAIGQLDEQIETKELEIKSRLDLIKQIVQQMWLDGDRTPIEILAGDSTFSEMVSQINQMTNLNDSLAENIESLNKAKTELENTRSQKLESQKELGDAQIILKAKAEELDTFIAEYSGKQDKYAQDIAKQQQEITEGQTLLNKLQTEQDAKLQEIRKKREEQLKKEAEAKAKLLAANPATSGSGNNAKALVSANEGNPNYGSCKTLTMPGTFPIKFGTLGTPTNGALTQKYGSTSLSHSIYSCHNGVDIAASCGTPIVATDDGVVYASDFARGGYGNYIVLEHNYGQKGRLYSLYGHMGSKSSLAIGSRVSKGDLLGNVGSTGFSTGCHLHFTLIDGETIIYDRGRAGSSPVGLYYNPLDYVSV